jgi:GNAT superfamily N-acetyltransferase
MVCSVRARFTLLAENGFWTSTRLYTQLSRRRKELYVVSDVSLAVLPKYRRHGIGTALHQELKAHPQGGSLVGGYALLDSPVIPFLEKIEYIPASSIL